MKISMSKHKGIKHMSLAAAITACSLGVAVSSAPAFAGERVIGTTRSTINFSPISVKKGKVGTQGYNNIRFLNSQIASVVKRFNANNSALRLGSAMRQLEGLQKTLSHALRDAKKLSGKGDRKLQNRNATKILLKLDGAINRLLNNLSKQKSRGVVYVEPSSASDSVVYLMDQKIAELQISLAYAMGGGGGGSGSEGETSACVYDEATAAQAEETLNSLNDAAAALSEALDESNLAELTAEEKEEVIEAAKAVASLLDAARGATST